MTLSDRAQRGLVIAMATLLALPVVLLPYPPMTDLPHHEALVALLKNLGDESLFPPGLYHRNLGHPNQLFHLVAWPLSYVFGVTLACKLVVAGSVAGIVLGTWRLARHRGVTPLAALAMAPVAIGWLFNWGFVNNLMALGIFFATLPLADRYAEAPSRKALALTMASALLLYTSHELIMLVYVGALGLFGLVRARTVRGLLVRWLPPVIVLGGAALQMALQEKLKADSVKMVPNVWTSFGEKVREVPSVLVGGADRSARFLLFGLVVGFVVVLLTARGRAPEAAPVASVSKAAGARTLAEAYRFELLALATLGLYFVAPFAFSGAMLVHERFLAPAFGIAVVCAAVRTVPRLLPTIGAAALPIAALAMALPWFGDAARNYAALESLFELIPHKSSVAAIEMDRTPVGRPFTVMSGLSRVLVRRGGRVLYSFVDSPVAPARFAPRYQWNEPSARIMFNDPKFRPRHDLTRFRYLLVHATDPRRLVLASAALQEEAMPLAAQGEWALFESKLEVVPLDSPDVPLPEPRPETWGRRLWFLEKDMRDRNAVSPETL